MIQLDRKTYLGAIHWIPVATRKSVTIIDHREAKIAKIGSRWIVSRGWDSIPLEAVLNNLFDVFRTT